MYVIMRLHGNLFFQSYLVRNSTPTFVFTVKSGDVDSRHLKSNQLVNHFGKSRTFTTKVCANLFRYLNVGTAQLNVYVYSLSFVESVQKLQFHVSEPLPASINKYISHSQK